MSGLLEVQKIDTSHDGVKTWILYERLLFLVLYRWISFLIGR